LNSGPRFFVFCAASYVEDILAGKVTELAALSASLEARLASERAAKERIAALENELDLLKGSSAGRISALDAALADASAALDATRADARAAHLVASDARDALMVKLRESARRVEALEEELALLLLGEQAIIPRVAKHVPPPFVPTVRTLRLVVGHILAEKVAADVHDDETPGATRQTLDHFVYDYFLLRFGVQQLAEAHISALVRGITTHWERGGSGRLGTFGALLGCLPASALQGSGGGDDETGGKASLAIANDEVALGFYLHVRCAVFFRCGGVPATELEDGAAEVPTAVVREVVTASLAAVMPAADVVAQMAAAGGGADDDDLIDLDRALAAALVVWSTARAAAGDRVAQLFHEHDVNGDGAMTWTEFSSFVEACQPGISVRGKKELFREAIRKGGPGGDTDTAAASPATVRTVAMKHGLGFLPAAPPLDPLISAGAPALPFDEFGLLQEVWTAAGDRARVALEEKKRDELARAGALRGKRSGGGGDEAGAETGDADELCAMVEQFQGLVMSTAPGTERAAWQLIRRVLLAVHLWEQGGEMRAREEQGKMGAGAYGAIQGLTAGAQP